MSRPRKPFGANHPGRLPATMIKVLAAEMSDPPRLRRGKQYAKDGSVIYIVIEPGVVTCEVQGTRATPYVATIEVTAGSGMPLRRDVTTHCTCPDDDNWDNLACKHAVAAMFVLSDELLLEPELLDRWRSSSSHDGPSATEHDDRTARHASGDHESIVGREPDDESGREPGDDTASLRRRRHLRLVGDDERADPTPVSAPSGDRLAGLLDVPAGATLPEIPDIERHEPLEPADRLLAGALRDAIAHLRLDWD